MAKAKTASKNDPSNRQKQADVFFNGKKVKPVKFVSEGSSFISGEYEDGSLITDAEGNPLPWSSVVSDSQ